MSLSYRFSLLRQSSNDASLNGRFRRLRTISLRKVFFCLVLIVGLIFFAFVNEEWQQDALPIRPGLWKVITEPKGPGGRWRIPHRWQRDAFAVNSDINLSPKTAVEAAELALNLAHSQNRYMDHSSIPLIVHQTWRSMNPDQWNSKITRAVGAWLNYCDPDDSADGEDMAYILWDDIGIQMFMEKYESEYLDTFWALPSVVERTDVFRVVVLKWFGGVYGDIDTQPIKAPVTWIYESDLEPWTDASLNATYSPSNPPPSYPYPSGVPITFTMPPTTTNHSKTSFSKGTPDTTTAAAPSHTSRYSASSDARNKSTISTHPRVINAIFGIEADFPPQKDTYWRAGYGFPTQLTNWALAMAPHHPIASRFQTAVKVQVDEDEEHLRTAYAVDLTGPVMITRVVSAWLGEIAGLRWNAVSGLEDGSRGKVVQDVLVLPQEGFHPKLGRHFLVGGTKDRAARLSHYAQGSWRQFDIEVETGKLCRTLFGLCRTWGKERPIITLPHSDSA